MLTSAAAATLRQLSETERGERSRRAAAGALVLAAVERALSGAADDFGLRRAHHEVEGLQRCAEKSVLLRMLILVEDGTQEERLARPLVAYACELERTRRLPEAE